MYHSYLPEVVVLDADVLVVYRGLGNFPYPFGVCELLIISKIALWVFLLFIKLCC